MQGQSKVHTQGRVRACGGQGGHFLAHRGSGMFFIESLLDWLFQHQHHFPFEPARSPPVHLKSTAALGGEGCVDSDPSFVHLFI